MDERIRKACEGKTRTQGGLNLSDIREMTGNTTATRDELIPLLCNPQNKGQAVQQSKSQQRRVQETQQRQQRRQRRQAKETTTDFYYSSKSQHLENGQTVLQEVEVVGDQGTRKVITNGQTHTEKLTPKHVEQLKESALHGAVIQVISPLALI